MLTNSLHEPKDHLSGVPSTQTHSVVRHERFTNKSTSLLYNIADSVTWSEHVFGCFTTPVIYLSSLVFVSSKYKVRRNSSVGIVTLRKQSRDPTSEPQIAIRVRNRKSKMVCTKESLSSVNTRLLCTFISIGTAIPV